MNQNFPFLPDHSPLNEVRYQKARAMREAGINPYPAHFTITHSAAELIANCDEYLDNETKQISLLGRVLTVRSFGKAAFFHLLDHTGRIQVHIDKRVLSDEDFRVYKEFLDTGDIVGVAGHLFRTKKGEITIEAKSLQLLTKSTRPLPEKWHGLTDKEIRYRQRYVDLIVNPHVVESFRTRSKILASMRRWLDEQDFLEVETPMMQPMYGGASARPFATHHNALDIDLYLRIAPELYLKRLVVGGMHRIYEINRNFRNEGISAQHNPEFTMLELYAAGWNCTEMMCFVEQLLTETLRLATGQTNVPIQESDFDFATHPWPRITILEAIEKHTGIHVNWGMSLDQIQKAAPNAAIPSEVKTGTDAIIYLFETQVEEHLIEPTFITEFPKAVSPLAKSKDNEPEIADRFELYINRMEIANGFSELNDPAEQYARFAEQVERRKAGDVEAVGTIDEDYVRALEYGMPPAAGLGVGIDRFVMVATHNPSIRDVILFPLMRPQREETSTEQNNEER